MSLFSIFRGRSKEESNLLKGFIVFILAFSSTFSLQAQQREFPQPLSVIDVRFEQLPSLVETQNVQSAQMAAFENLQNRIPGLKVDWNVLTGTVTMLRSLNRFLTPPSTENPRTIALDFFRSNLNLFGLQDADLLNLDITQDAVTKRSGIRRLIFQQKHNGIYLYSGELRVNFTSRGEVINSSGDIIPSLASAIQATTPTITAEQAITAAANSIDAEITAPLQLKSGPEGTMRKNIFVKGADFSDDIRVQLYYWAINRTTVRLIWQVFIGARNSGYTYQVFVDAQNGQILYRATITQSHRRVDTAKWRVFTSDSPSPMSPGPATPDGTQPPLVSRDLVETNGDPAASPEGWIPDGTTTTTGNNADAFIDSDDDGTPDVARPESATREFDFPLDLTAAPTTTDNQNSAVVNTFYWANWYHDRLYELGFDEAAGNFQNDNFGLGGADGDAIEIRVQSGFDNSTFSTQPDGTPGIWRVFIFTGSDPDRDAALDQEIAIHELTHGLTNRLVGGPTVTMPFSTQPWAMGEGWSDFYAIALLAEPGDDLNGNYAIGAYSVFNLFVDPPGWDDNYYFGIRRYPYSRNMSTSPLTFADIDPAQFDVDTAIPTDPFFSTQPADEFHNAGEIWCLALLECHANLIDYYGFNVGNELMLQLVTDGLSLITTNTPTFIEARDAIFSADLAANGGANHCLLWAGFSQRGLGPGASSPAFTTTSGVVESFHDALPAADATRPPVDIILVLDVSGSMGSIAPGGTDPKIEVLWDAVEMFINSWLPFAIPGDRMGAVFLESGVTSFPTVSPILLPFCSNAKELVEMIRAEAAGGWTAMGGGILTAKNGFEAGSPNNRFIVLFTDGMQNFSPMVVGMPPDHEIQTLPIDPGGTPPVQGESGVAGEPGVAIADYGVTIQVIGVGVAASYQSLLEDIATEADGSFYFTDAPDAALRDFYEMSLVTALSTTSVERVNHFTREYRNEMGEVSVNFNMNRSANRAAFILSWRGDKRPDAMTFRLISPDGDEISLTSKTRNGDFFKIVAFSLPSLQNGNPINHAGEWQMLISGKLRIGSTVYDASLLVDEPTLKLDFSIANRVYGTGDPIPISVQMKEDDTPIKNLEKALVRITRPASGLGTLLAQNFVDRDSLAGDFGLDPDHFPTLVEKKQHFLLQNAKFRDNLGNRIVDNVTLYDDATHGDATASDGIYSADYTETTRPGLYEFEFEVTGSAPKVGNFFRTEIFSTDVRVKVPDAEKTDVVASEVMGQPNVYQLSVTPVDQFDNFLGPGYVAAVRITTSAGTLSKVEDGLDGSYQAILQLPATEDPKTTVVKVEVLGKKVEETTLKKLLTPRERFGISAHVGAAIPHGDFDASFDPSFNFTIDFEFRLTNQLSLEGLAGYHRFSGSASSDFFFVNFCGNLKYFLTTGGVVPFVNGGVGVYIPDEGRTSFGFNVGGGISYELSPNWYLESSYNFHRVSTEVMSTTFSTAQGGLRFRF